MIIALDGHSSCGKSTYAKLIAAELGYAYVDSGAMYRAVTLAAMKEGYFEKTDAPEAEKIEALLDRIRLDLRFNPEMERTEIFLNGQMVEDRIRQMDVATHASYIAAIPAVRRKLVEYQRSLGGKKGIVMDGRDIGTVVFPQAELKIFLTASEEVRALRRFKELQEKNMPASLEEVRENIRKRDHIDSTRADSPLRKAEDAIELDNSHMTLDDQMKWFAKVFKETAEKHGAQH
jgi:cytidylate kinase